MTTFEYKRQFERTVTFERTFSKTSVPENILERSQYEIMTTWILEHLDDLKCHNSTKYLAKTYLDSYLSKQRSIRSDDLHLVAITVARLAVKFNESCQYSVGFAEKMGNFRYLSQEFIRMQNDVLVALGFNLNYITPYHYLPIIQKLIPLGQQITEQIQSLIDFSCTLKQLSTLCAGQLLLSILMYLAYCYDPQKISIIKQYEQIFPNISNVVALLNEKAAEETDDQTL